MPPKAAIARPLSPSPPPLPPVVSAAASAHTEQNDILVIQDFMDTIDQIPTELTRVHSDLNELGAVLYSTLCNLERKLHQLIDQVQSPRVGPEQRFQLLQEIAEEAARYKLGGDDKIRVAGGACDGIMAHQRHISNLLKHSTLLEKDPPSPYTAALTLPQQPVTAATRRGQTRATGSPFPGRHDDRATPTKKRKNRKEVGRVDDDDASSVNGRDEKKKAPVRKKKTNRAVSPSESVASTAVYGKPSEPVARTARQIAAAAAKARAAQKKDEDSDESGDDEPRRGGKAMQVSASNDSTAAGGALGIDLGSREGSAGKSGGTTPAQQSGGDKRARAGGRGTKRARGDEEDEEDEEEQDEEPPAKRPGGATASAKKSAATYAESAVADTDNGAGDAEVDSKVYCTCRQFSYGEMIGCDDDECEIEWYHVACLNLDKAPEGNWICPQCLERRKRNPKAKKPAKPKRK